MKYPYSLFGKDPCVHSHGQLASISMICTPLMHHEAESDTLSACYLLYAHVTIELKVLFAFFFTYSLFKCFTRTGLWLGTWHRRHCYDKHINKNTVLVIKRKAFALISNKCSQIKLYNKKNCSTPSSEDELPNPICFKFTFS